MAPAWWLAGWADWWLRHGRLAQQGCRGRGLARCQALLPPGSCPLAEHPLTRRPTTSLRPPRPPAAAPWRPSCSTCRRTSGKCTARRYGTVPHVLLSAVCRRPLPAARCPLGAPPAWLNAARPAAFLPSPPRPGVQHEVQSALPKIVTAGFKAVRLIYYFTAGVQEVGGRWAPTSAQAALWVDATDRGGCVLRICVLAAHAACSACLPASPCHHGASARPSPTTGPSPLCVLCVL